MHTESVFINDNTKHMSDPIVKPPYYNITTIIINHHNKKIPGYATDMAI